MLCADSCACWLVGVAQATATGAINWAIQLAAGPALAAGSDFRMPRNAQREMRSNLCSIRPVAGTSNYIFVPSEAICSMNANLSICQLQLYQQPPSIHRHTLEALNLSA